MGGEPGNTINQSGPVRRNQLSGIVALFGWFFALCGILSLMATAFDAWNEWRCAGWPTSTAIITSCEVPDYHPFKSSGGGVTWSIRCRIRFNADGKEWTSTIRSRSTRTSEDHSRMDDWVRKHYEGAEVPIRYNPGDPSNAIFASDDVPLTGPQSRSDLALAAI